MAMSNHSSASFLRIVFLAMHRQTRYIARPKILLGMMGFSFCLLTLLLTGCAANIASTATSSGSQAAPSLNLQAQVSVSDIYLNSTQTTVKDIVTITGVASGGSTTVSFSNLPSSVSAKTTGFGSSLSGSVVFSLLQEDSIGDYPVQIVINSSNTQASSTITLHLNSDQITISAASSGTFDMHLSTNIPVAAWNIPPYANVLNASQFSKLNAYHPRAVPDSAGLALIGEGQWNFTTLDAVMQPLLRASSSSPMFGVNIAPSFMYDSTGTNLRDASFKEFGTFAANLVSYFNGAGIITRSATYKSAAETPVKYWGVWNEPNYSNVSPEQYVQMYNTVVPMMKSVDSSIKTVALELGTTNDAIQKYVPYFVKNVTAPVDVMAMHLYSTTDYTSTDQAVFSTIPMFASQIASVRQIMNTSSTTAGKELWITENNVNCDFAGPGGVDSDFPNRQYIPDPRGTSAFFTAWRPYVFSVAVKNGANALHQFYFASSTQYAEVDQFSGEYYLSYWVDYELASAFNGLSNAKILQTADDSSVGIDTLAVQGEGGDLILLVSNHAVNKSNDINGAGSARNVVIDMSAFNTFNSGTLVQIDGKTDLVNGPISQQIAATKLLNITFSGYGTAIVHMYPTKASAALSK